MIDQLGWTAQSSGEKYGDLNCKSFREDGVNFSLNGALRNFRLAPSPTPWDKRKFMCQNIRILFVIG